VNWKWVLRDRKHGYRTAVMQIAMIDHWTSVVWLLYAVEPVISHFPYRYFPDRRFPDRHFPDRCFPYRHFPDRIHVFPGFYEQ